MGERVSARSKTSAQPSMTASVKVGLSQRHLAAAEYFASQCKAIETEEAPMDWPQPRWAELQSYSAATVILAVAALEASANELYLQATDRSQSALEPLSDKQLSLLAQLWHEVGQFRILNKYQVALTACGKEPMEMGAEPYQSASTLIALSEDFRFGSPSVSVYPRGPQKTRIFEACKQARTGSRLAGGPLLPLDQADPLLPRRFLRHPYDPPPLKNQISHPKGTVLAARHRQRPDPRQHLAEQLPVQIPLGQKQPVIPSMLDQPSAGLHEPVLQTRQRPAANPPWQPEPPPEVAQVVGQDAELESHFIRSEASFGPTFFCFFPTYDHTSSSSRSTPPWSSSARVERLA